MRPLRCLFAILIVAALALMNFSPSQALTASLVEVTNFGDNPSNLRMFVYIPTTVLPNPPILVVVHWCTGSAEAIYSGTQYAALADQYGYMIVYPSVTRSSGCFDVSSAAALSRGGGSDPVGIMSMITYAAQHYDGDLNRVYVTGISSGAMMTNVLLGDYPDVFKAGAAFAGVPFGCFATTDGSEWNGNCSSGLIIKTPEEWGDLVRAAYPGYTGARPRMQLWHGTEDTGLSYVNFGEEIKQWTNVLGASQTPVSTDYPQSTWTRTRYANSAGEVVVEAISEQGVTHSIQVDEAAVLRFFGLDGSVTPTPSVTPTGTQPTKTPTRTATITNTPVPGSCKVTYTKNQWSNGFTADVKITNNNTTAIQGWTLTWTFANGQQLTGSWNATVSQSGANVTASNPASHWNGTLAANGGTASFGFQATFSGTNADPTNFTLNGTLCNATDVTPTRTNTGTTPTYTPTRTNTSVTPTHTPTRTNTSVTPTYTPTRTNTGTTPTYTPTRTNTPGTPTTGCKVTYTSNQWNTGFTADVKITNTSSSVISGWTLTWTFANGQQITGSWNATVTQSGATVTASNVASHWNGTLAAGGSASFGFQATHAGTNATPTDFALNGVACSVGN